MSQGDSGAKYTAATSATELPQAPDCDSSLDRDTDRHNSSRVEAADTDTDTLLQPNRRVVIEEFSEEDTGIVDQDSSSRVGPSASASASSTIMMGKNASGGKQGGGGFSPSRHLPIMVFAALVLFGLFLVVRVQADDHKNGESQTSVLSNCTQPFGTPIGYAFNTTAYSNCNCSYISEENHWVLWENTTEGGQRNKVFSGMEWQCVEFARRFMIMHDQAVFGSVVGADDIWNLTTVSSLLNGEELPFGKTPNVVGTTLPIVGDLIIYPRQPGGFPFGHVAVTVGIDSQYVYVAEQNWESHRWDGYSGNYSRALRWTNTTTANGLDHGYTLHDSTYQIDGWKHIDA